VVFPSGYLCLRMFYYTHHSDMDAMQYVHADVPSESVSLTVLLHTSQRHGRSPINTLLMYLQPTCAPEHFITPITAIWTLPSMYTLMYLQTICFTECFMAPITAIRNLPRMYTLISFMLTVHLYIIL